MKTKYSLSPEQHAQWHTLVDAGKRKRIAKYGERAEKHRVDKNGGIDLNWDNEAHVRACAYVLLYASKRISVHKAIAETGCDWLTVTTLANHCQEFHDAWCAMYEAQAARIKGQARTLVEETMSGEDVSNAQGRMASWALERLDDEFKTKEPDTGKQQAQSQLGGGIVINLIASACDNGATQGNIIDAQVVEPAQIGHNDA